MGSAKRAQPERRRRLGAHRAVLSACLCGVLGVCPTFTWMGAWRKTRSLSAGAQAQLDTARVDILQRKARGGFFEPGERPIWEDQFTVQDFMKQATMQLRGKTRDAATGGGGGLGCGLRVLEWRTRGSVYLNALRDVIGVVPYYVADNIMDPRGTDAFPTFGPFERTQVKWHVSDSDGKTQLKKSFFDLILIDEIPDDPGTLDFNQDFDAVAESRSDEENEEQAERLAVQFPESQRLLKPTGRLVYFSATNDDLPSEVTRFFTNSNELKDNQMGVKAVLLIPNVVADEDKPAKKKRRRKVPLPPDAVQPSD